MFLKWKSQSSSNLSRMVIAHGSQCSVPHDSPFFQSDRDCQTPFGVQPQIDSNKLNMLRAWTLYTKPSSNWEYVAIGEECRFEKKVFWLQPHKQAKDDPTLRLAWLECVACCDVHWERLCRNIACQTEDGNLWYCSNGFSTSVYIHPEACIFWKHLLSHLVDVVAPRSQSCRTIW